MASAQDQLSELPIALTVRDRAKVVVPPREFTYWNVARFELSPKSVLINRQIKTTLVAVVASMRYRVDRALSRCSEDSVPWTGVGKGLVVVKVH